MKVLYIVLVVVFVFLIAFFIKGKLGSPKMTAADPFTNESGKRDQVVVISDLHLGADLKYAEFNKNAQALINFLKKVQNSSSVKELVIGGDLFDEWFVPAVVDTYQGKDQADFAKRIVQSNKGVFDAFNSIIQEGKIVVTYVPGNHDLTIKPEQIENALPGVKQARDKELGLGTYSPTDLPQVAIEHGHRYNLFCAPDPISNQDVAPGTIMPPGYFFTRIAAQSIVEQCKSSDNVIPEVTKNSSSNVSQELMYGYWEDWQFTLKTFPLTNKFDEKMIVTNVDKFTANYSVNDLLPYQTTPNGKIDVNLYKGIQDTWKERQALNGVQVDIPTDRAIKYVAEPKELDSQAAVQYFTNPNSDKRIVVFGHTHVAQLMPSYNTADKKTIYANSGTWIDSNPNGTTMNFVVISPQGTDPSSQTKVKLYNFENEVVTMMGEDSLRLD